MNQVNPQFWQRCLNELQKIVFKHTPDSIQTFLFGSCATGENLKSSDIDVGFLSSTPLDRSIFRHIRDEIEASSIPFPVDLVDFSTVNDEFKAIALQHTIPWKRSLKN